MPFGFWGESKMSYAHNRTKKNRKHDPEGYKKRAKEIREAKKDEGKYVTFKL